MSPPGPSTGSARDRLIRYVSSRPYVTSGVTALVLAVTWNSVSTVFESSGGHGRLDRFVIGFVVYAIVVSLVLVPRWLAPKMSADGREGPLFVIGWAIAVAPFLVALDATLSGAAGWVMPLGFVTAVVLMFLNARRATLP
jgi:hypothetical protein